MAEYLIYGAGGFAREVAWLAERCGHSVAAFIDDDRANIGSLINEIPVISLTTAAASHPSALFVAAVGRPATRRTMVGRAEAAGLKAGMLVHPNVEHSRWVTIGPGSVVCAGNILTTNITIGRDVQINLDCTIGHDVVMHDHATLAPGVHVSGWVRLEEGAYIGTGANIINGVKEAPIVIGAGAVVGAGACVTRSVEPGTTVVGIPAKARSAQ